MTRPNEESGVRKVPTGIPGFDLLAEGGVPEGRATLLAGSAGSAKTVFACQFLVEGIRQLGEPGVFVTFEETPEEIRRNVSGFGWDIASFEKDGRWSFVDGSPQVGVETILLENYDLGGLLARVEHAVQQTGSKRVVLDSICAIFSQFTDRSTVRAELHRATVALRGLGVTSILTSERVQEYGDTARLGIEEFVADNVVILRNALENERRRRTIEILKFRGARHRDGQHPFTIVSEQGITMPPLPTQQLSKPSSKERTTAGDPELDKMCGGGFLTNSMVMVTGSTGTGKTLLVTQFLARGGANDRSLLFAFEESRQQLLRNAHGWGMDLEHLEASGRLRTVCCYPERSGLDERLLEIAKEIEEYKPTRVAIDSLSALARASSTKQWHEFMIGLVSLLRSRGVTTVLSAVTPSSFSGFPGIDSRVSTLTDSIIVLRYVEILGEMRRGLAVLKMRGSQHDKGIREFVIDETGMHLRERFREVSGILMGTPHLVSASETDRVARLFRDDEDAAA